MPVLAYSYVVPSMVPSKSKMASNNERKWRIRLSWDESCKELEKYYAINGHCNPPNRDYPKLGLWVKQQRRRTQCALHAHQVNRLDALHFSWETPKTKKERQWKVMAKRLKTYLQIMVSTSNSNGSMDQLGFFNKDPQLSCWVKQQQADYRKGVLSEDRKRKLESIKGFLWYKHNRGGKPGARAPARGQPVDPPPTSKGN